MSRPTSKYFIATKATPNAILPSLPIIFTNGSSKISINSCSNLLKNTCTIDNFLMIFLYSFIELDSFKEILTQDTRPQALALCTFFDKVNSDPSSKNVHRERLQWVIKVSPSVKNRPGTQEINLYGNDYDMLQTTLGSLLDLVITIRSLHCQIQSNERVNQFIVSGRINAQYIQRTLEAQWHDQYKKQCEHCSSLVTIDLKHPPTVIWLHVQGRSSLSASEFPQSISIHSNTYAIRGFIIHRPGHYSSVFRYREAVFCYDDLKKSSVTPYRGGFMHISAIVLVQVKPAENDNAQCEEI